MAELFGEEPIPTWRWSPYAGGPPGVLPQGAPTSPMLSNLATKTLDSRLADFAIDRGMVYTRYADDITISCSHLPSRKGLGSICTSVVNIITRCGFQENREKRHVAGPGAKKVVLGLLVDGAEPRISRETYQRIDRLLYGAKVYGIVDAASHFGFDSAFGFLNHLSGLVRFVKDVDHQRWVRFDIRLQEIQLADGILD